MKVLLHLTKVGFVIGLFASIMACDEITNPYPPRKTVALSDSAKIDSIEAARGLLNQPPVRKVLLEDYTGHQCGNCPRAAEVAKTLSAQHQANLVVLAVHVGFFAETDPGTFSYDFTTPPGNALNTYYGVENFGLPQGMVNRIIPQGSSSPVITQTAWSTVVTNELNKQPQAQIAITPLYKSATRSLQGKVSVKWNQTLTGNHKLCVFLVEDSIIKPQKDYSLPSPGVIPAYVHRHVLRDAITDVWGISLGEGTKTAGTTSSYYFALANGIPDRFNDKHCHLQAFIYEDRGDQNRPIIQAAEVSIME